MEKMPYDSVFRTMLNDCSGLIIPLINEAFGEDYTGDSSLLIRIFEYDSQIALYDGEVRNRCLEVTFPHSAVLYLRSTGNTPDSLTIGINTLFRYEDLIKNPDSYKEYEDGIISDYQYIRDRLNALMLCGAIDEYSKCMITDMTVKVVRNLADKNEDIKEKVGGVMVGGVLDYEAKRILNRGIERGREEGIRGGIEQGITSFVKLALKYGEKEEKAVEFGVTKQHILNVLDKNNYQKQDE